MGSYLDPRQVEVLQQLTIHMANARFYYGFEYLGVQDRLVQTLLIDPTWLPGDDTSAGSMAWWITLRSGRYR